MNISPRSTSISSRILRAIELDSLLEALLNWVNKQREQDGKPVIAFDGKALRRAYRNEKKNAVQLVTAYDTERGLMLSQKATATKNGEISVVRQMLDTPTRTGIPNFTRRFFLSTNCIKITQDDFARDLSVNATEPIHCCA